MLQIISGGSHGDERLLKLLPVLDEIKAEYLISPYFSAATPAVGCSMAHLKCIERAQKYNETIAVVAEDDLVLTHPDSLARFYELIHTLPDNWLFFYAGAYGVLKWHDLGDGVARVERPGGTHLIAYSPAGQEFAQRYPAEGKGAQWDRWLNCAGYEHSYCAYPMLAYQAAGYSMNIHGYCDYRHMLNGIPLYKADSFK